eukprot:TRINITY_DN11428_c0_g1_i1.p2 TRINITY_DN11428_c0_g1~~TRINITY_DN11428_c0_g1_i1.p2  ORF type:complete len:249 (-),score=53.17 TRINITY_DN11428_c0_g1_i1:99-845(-)
MAAAEAGALPRQCWNDQLSKENQHQLQQAVRNGRPRARALAMLVVATVVAGAAGAPEAEAAPEEACLPAAAVAEAIGELRQELASCQATSAAAAAGRKEAQPARSDSPPAWPKGFGTLLRFPFGISDMKALKNYARAIWQPDGTAANIEEEVTDKGFQQRRGARCTSEMVGVHPIGAPAERWSKELWSSAQDWCLDQANCTGIMLYVGKQSMNCHQWCGRPQFCSEPITENEGFETSTDWNLFVKGHA